MLKEEDQVMQKWVGACDDGGDVGKMSVRRDGFL